MQALRKVELETAVMHEDVNKADPKVLPSRSRHISTSATLFGIINYLVCYRAWPTAILEGFLYPLGAQPSDSTPEDIYPSLPIWELKTISDASSIARRQ